MDIILRFYGTLFELIFSVWLTTQIVGCFVLVIFLILIFLLWLMILLVVYIFWLSPFIFIFLIVLLHDNYYNLLQDTASFNYGINFNWLILKLKKRKILDILFFFYRKSRQLASTQSIIVEHAVLRKSQGSCFMKPSRLRGSVTISRGPKREFCYRL